MTVINLGLVDEHVLLRRGVKSLLERYTDLNVVLEASSGEEMKILLSSAQVMPDIMLIDIKLKGITGPEAVSFVHIAYPSIKIIAFSFLDHIDVISEMFDNGAMGFISKSSDTGRLVNTIFSVMDGKMVIEKPVADFSVKDLHRYLKKRPHFSERERKFLTLCGTELTYKEIAVQMGVSPKTVDRYREKLFEQLAVKSRAGLLLYGFRNGLIA